MRKLRFDFDALKRLVQFAAQRGSDDRLAQVAGSLTFTTMLALVPFATVAFALFTAFPIFSTFQISLQHFLADHLMPAQINTQIFHYLSEFTTKAKGLTTVGMIALFITAVTTMMTIESAFNIIWRVPKPRPFAQRVLAYWAIVTLGPLLIGVSLSLSAYLFTRSPFFAGWQLSPLIGGILTSAALPLTTLAFAMLYVYLPNCPVRWRDALVGGFIAAVGFELAKRGFGLYVRRIPTYTVVYGAFATAPMFLLWIYLCWLITLIGATVASALPAVRIGQFHRRDYPGDELLAALQLLVCLRDAREVGIPGHTVEALARMLRINMDSVTDVLKKLREYEWVGCLETDGEPVRYVLLANPAHMTVKRLFDDFVINRSELAYQLRLAPARIDCAALLDALDNEKLDISLAQLIAHEPPVA